MEETPKAIEDIELSEKKGKKEEEGEEGTVAPGGKTAPEAKKKTRNNHLNLNCETASFATPFAARRREKSKFSAENYAS